MVDRENSRLKEMDLTKLTNKDLFVSQDDDWDSRNDLHNELKNSNLITNKPIGNYFEFEENSIDKDYISCHLIIPVVVSKVKPWVPHSNYLDSSEESEENEEDNEIDYLGVEDSPTPAETSAAKKAGTFANSGVKTTKDVEPEPTKKEELREIELQAEYDWAMEEAAVWNMEHMRFDELSHKDKYLTFRHASDPDTYPVPDYFEYIPSHVRNAEEKYKKKSFNKHVGKYKNLKMENIEISYRMLKCNMPLYDDQKMQRHYKRVHLLPNGYASLKKRESIKINTDLEFKFEDMKHFQDVSQDKQNMLLDKMYTVSVATGVISER